MRTVKFGVIGCGLMGREFASASMRWCHLAEDIDKPEIIAVCDVEKSARDWFVENLPSVKYSFDNYRELLALKEVDAVYVALPHMLHEEVYIAVIEAGKHLMGEKPFGMDVKQNEAILNCLSQHPNVFARCTSEFPYYPAYQVLIDWIKEKKFGRIIEVRSCMYHSSDMDLNKPINWKRMKCFNGEYGCMGDLGIHVQHVPFRFGWQPTSVYAYLSKIVTQRKNNKGEVVACDTWDNATLLCNAEQDGYKFPIIYEMKRMAPGSTNNVFLEVYGMELSARFTTNNPNALYFTTSWGKEQAWSRIVVGNKPMNQTITGSIFEQGFSDVILQMWATYMKELSGKEVKFGCFTPEETRMSHKVLNAALESHHKQILVEVQY
jgi:predicted dehydrogenase